MTSSLDKTRCNCQSFINFLWLSSHPASYILCIHHYFFMWSFNLPYYLFKSLQCFFFTNNVTHCHHMTAENIIPDIMPHFLLLDVIPHNNLNNSWLYKETQEWKDVLKGQELKRCFERKVTERQFRRRL